MLKKNNIGIVFLLFFVVTSGCIDNEKLDPDMGEINAGVMFIPANCTHEVWELYNNSEIIEYLEYNEINTININNESKELDKVTVIAIPDDMENRGCFKVDTKIKITNNDNVLIGNNTIVTECETRIAYLFISKSLAEELYEMDNYHYSVYMGFDKLEFKYFNLIV